MAYVLELLLAQSSPYFVPSYEKVARDDVFFIEYEAVEASVEDELEDGRSDYTVFLWAVNPNIKGLREFIKTLYTLVGEGDVDGFRNYVSKNFTFYLDGQSISYFHSIGMDSRHYKLMFTQAFFDDFKGKYTSIEWRGVKAVTKVFRYIPKEILLAAFSNGYVVALDEDVFNNTLGKLSYSEIVKRLKEEEVDLSKGTYWLEKSELVRLLGRGEVWLPYFWQNSWVPGKIKEYPYTYVEHPLFFPPPIAILLKWVPDKNTWVLESIAYGWNDIFD